jgi:hypothetical protein
VGERDMPTLVGGKNGHFGIVSAENIFTLTMKCFSCGYEKSFIFQIENGYNKDRNIIFCKNEVNFFPKKGIYFHNMRGEFANWLIF